MSKKRQTRNSKKFKKAAASQRAREPMRRGGSFTPQTISEAQKKGRQPKRPAGQTDGINPTPTKGLPPRTTAGPKPTSAPAGRIMPTKMPVDTKGPISSVMMSDGVSAPRGIMSDGFVPPEMSGRVMPTRRPSPAEQQRNAEIARIQQEKMASMQEAIARGEVPIREPYKLQGQQQTARTTAARQTIAPNSLVLPPDSSEMTQDSPDTSSSTSSYEEGRRRQEEARSNAEIAAAAEAAAAAAAALGYGSTANGTSSGQGTPTDAPIDLEINRPDLPVLEKVVAEKVAEGDASVAEQMSDTGDAVAGTATAFEATAGEDIDAAQADTPSFGIPSGYSTSPSEGVNYLSVMPPEGQIFIYSQETGERIAIDKPDGMAAQMEAAIAEGIAPGKGVTGELSEGAIARFDEGTITTPAVAAKRDPIQEAEARAVAARRPEARDYAEAATTDERFEVGDVEGPEVITREGNVISDDEVGILRQIAQGRGVPLEDLPEYKLAQQRVAQQGEAATAEYRSRLGPAPQEEAARAEFFGVEDTPQARQVRIAEFESFDAAKREAYTSMGVDAPEAAQMEEVRKAAAASREAITADSSPEMVAEQTNLDNLPTYQMAAKRTAQVAEAAQGIATQLEGQPAVDLEGREAITGTAPVGDAAQIGGIPTAQAAQMQAVTGKERRMAAADMATVVVEMPPEVTAAISEDPATVEAQLDTGADPQVIAAIAALPEEALVSTQMEGLLAGMEDGTVSFVG